jgi:hypothetical protein
VDAHANTHIYLITSHCGQLLPACFPKKLQERLPRNGLQCHVALYAQNPSGQWITSW